MSQEQRHSGAVRSWLGLAAVIGSLLGTAAAQFLGVRNYERASVSSTGKEGNGDSVFPRMSADGRLVAFVSEADNLVSVDTHGVPNVFVRDRLLRTTELVSVSSRESTVPGNQASGSPAISADGRFVAFASAANNLVDEDTNGVPNVFVRDRLTGRTELVSLTADGVPTDVPSGGPAISADGRYIAFWSQSDTLDPGRGNNAMDVFVRDRESGKTEPVSVTESGAPSNGNSFAPAISADGRSVAFTSQATNMVSGDTNGSEDIFLRDRTVGKTERVSLSSSGAQGNGRSFGPAISAEGRFVAFASFADNLVPGDRNNLPDFFVRDRMMARTERINTVTPSASADDGEHVRVCDISGDGNIIVYALFARNVIPGDPTGRAYVFLRDRAAGQTQVVSLSSDDTQPDARSFDPAISADGRVLAFASPATTLVHGDDNGISDVFVWDRLAGTEDLVAEPTSLAFGRLVVGTTQARRLKLRNAGTRTLAGSVGALTEPFSVSQGGGSFAMEPGASHIVEVTFAPTRVSAASGFQTSLVITRSDPNAPALNVPIVGESAGGGIGKLVLTPSPQQGVTLMLTVRELVYGECKPASLILQNGGTGPLSGNVEGLRLPFAVVEGEGPFSLAPGESKKIAVQFCAPVGRLPARYETALVITSRDGDVDKVTVPLRVVTP